MREWLFNVMRELAERDELSPHYKQLEKEAQGQGMQSRETEFVFGWEFLPIKIDQLTTFYAQAHCPALNSIFASRTRRSVGPTRRCGGGARWTRRRRTPPCPAMSSSRCARPSREQYTYDVHSVIVVKITQLIRNRSMATFPLARTSYAHAPQDA